MARALDPDVNPAALQLIRKRLEAAVRGEASPTPPVEPRASGEQQRALFEAATVPRERRRGRPRKVRPPEPKDLAESLEWALDPAKQTKPTE